MAEPYSYMAQSTQAPQQQQVTNNWGSNSYVDGGNQPTDQPGGTGGAGTGGQNAYGYDPNMYGPLGNPNPTGGDMMATGGYDLYGNGSQWGQGFQQGTDDWNPGAQLGQYDFAPTPGQNVFAGQPQGLSQIYGDKFYDPATYYDKNSPESRMLENTLPLRQQQYNEFTNNRDFNEAARRYGLEYAETLYGNRYNQMLTTRQQKAGEETARDASRLAWAGHSANLQQSDRDFLLGTRAADTSQYGADTQRLLGNEANRIDQMWKAGQLSNQQKEIELARLTQNQNNALAQQRYQLDQQIATAGTYEQQQAAILARQQLDMQRLFGTQGTFEQQQTADIARKQQALQEQVATAGNYEQRQAAEMALRNFELQKQIVTGGTWDQQAQQAFLQQQMAQQGQQFTQEQALRQQIATAGTYEQQQAASHQLRQLQQQAELAREQMATEKEMARWSRFGRNQTPNARWARSWQ